MLDRLADLVRLRPRIADLVEHGARIEAPPMPRKKRTKRGPGRPQGTGSGALGDGVARLERLTVRLSVDELEHLRDLALEKGEPVSTVVIRALRKAGALPRSP